MEYNHAIDNPPDVKLIRMNGNSFNTIPYKGKGNLIMSQNDSN